MADQVQGSICRPGDVKPKREHSPHTGMVTVQMYTLLPPHPDETASKEFKELFDKPLFVGSDFEAPWECWSDYFTIYASEVNNKIPALGGVAFEGADCVALNRERVNEFFERFKDHIWAKVHQQAKATGNKYKLLLYPGWAHVTQVTGPRGTILIYFDGTFALMPADPSQKQPRRVLKERTRGEVRKVGG